MLAIGHVDENTALCDVQGIFSNAGYLSAAFWTVVITYQLWYVVHYGQMVKDVFAASVFCWVVPWVLAVLPLTTNTFGDDDGGRQVSITCLTNTIYIVSQGELNLAHFSVFIQLVFDQCPQWVSQVDHFVLERGRLLLVDWPVCCDDADNARHDCTACALVHPQ